MTTAKSIPATDTTLTQAQASSQENAPKVNEPTVVSETAEATPRKNLAFPLALTILAVFPMALGLGTVRLKASASSVRTASDLIDIDRDAENSNPIPTVTDRRVGDREFLARRYEVALQYYRSLGSATPVQLPPDLLYRIALCQEGLGLWNEALESFRSVSGAAENSTLKAAANFGRARIKLRMNKPNQVVSLLRSVEFQSGDKHLLPRNMSREIGFLIPLALAHTAVSQGSGISHCEPVPTGELFSWSLESALGWADEPLQTESSALDASTPDNALRCRLNRPADQTNEALDLETANVEVCCQSQPLKLIVQSLADECGWKLDWSDLSNDLSLDRVVNFASESRPVSLTLTIICSELRSTWSIEDNCLTIKRADAEGHRSRRMISRTLASLANWTPNHRLANHTRFAIAELARYDGQLSAAALAFASLVGRDSSPLAIRAAYNAGMIYYQIGDFRRACFQLDYVVNGAPGHELHTESLILLGRLLLDTGEAQDAVYQLRRATEVHNRPDAQARAAVFLGLAYLVQDRFDEAAEVIFANKYHFEDPAVRNAAAFVTTFARWQSVTGPMQEREATFLYRALVSLKTNSEWLGQTGQLMIGHAYSELGFDDLMAHIYSQMLAIGVTENIEFELTFSLANYQYANGQTEVAIQTWDKLKTGTSNRWANRSRMRLAEIALGDGRAKDCLENCEFIKTDEGIVRTDIQKLQGRAYEYLGEDVLAAQCYSGQSPTP